MQGWKHVERECVEQLRISRRRIKGMLVENGEIREGLRANQAKYV